ncbi:unnamed protein product [Trichobilharzia regenti]|nr:unnamed protein product [Trichobilharzia regenti]
MPNFLSVETRPFDPNYYEDELDEDEILDEEGRTRLKLKVARHHGALHWTVDIRQSYRWSVASSNSSVSKYTLLDLRITHTMMLSNASNPSETTMIKYAESPHILS